MLHRTDIHRWTIAAIVAGTIGLAACGGETADQAASETAGEGEAATGAVMQAPHGNVSVVLFECVEGGFMLTMAEGTGKAALRIDETVYQLDEQEAEEPVMLYSDGSYTFRGEGGAATVEKDGEPILTECKASGHPM